MRTAALILLLCSFPANAQDWGRYAITVAPPSVGEMQAIRIPMPIPVVVLPVPVTMAIPKPMPEIPAFACDARGMRCWKVK